MMTGNVRRQRSRLMAGALFLGIMAGVGGTAFAQPAQAPKMPPRGERLLTPEDRAAIGQIFWHRTQQKLGLTDQQVADIRALLQDRRNAARADFQALRAARRQLRSLIGQPIADPAAVQSTAAQLKALQGKLFDERLQTQLAIRSKLTPEQWQRWTELRRDGMGRHWMRGGRGFGMRAL